MVIVVIVNKIVYLLLFFLVEFLELLVVVKEYIKYVCLKYLIKDNIDCFVFCISL